MTSNQNNFLIGPVKDGVRSDIKPWAIPEDSFQELVNMYQFRGRMLRRKGYSLLGRLSFLVSNQNIGAASTNVSVNLFTLLTLTGVTIIPGSISIVNSGGTSYNIIENLDNPGTLKLSSGAAAFTSGTINYNTGALNILFSVNPGGTVVITFSYSYNLPVMGLRTRELFSLNNQDTIAFDTVYSYKYDSGLSQFIGLPSVMPTIWSGTNYQFFFTTNYSGAFWATNSKPGLHGVAITGIDNANPAVVTAANNFTNGQTVTIINVSGYAPLATTTPPLNGQSFIISAVSPTAFTLTGLNGALYNVYGSGGMALNSYVSQTGQDGVRYYGDLTNGDGWANYNPPIDPNTALAGALLIFPYRGYLVFLNTTEGNEAGVSNFGNRARWTQIGTPYYSQPVPDVPNLQTVDIKAMRDDLFGRGGANDAPTQEVIIGAAFIRDVLIVYFERSCWRLRFVNNSQNPFVWERINVELGASATFSTIPFDKGLMAIGERGIVISDGNDLMRFDEKIPDTVFNIRVENQGMQRVYGIRTFRTRLNYWTFPSTEVPNGIFPNKVLVFNYDTKTWSFFDDTYTCFGYFYQFDDATWASLTMAWSEYDDTTMEGGDIDSGFERIIAGNQQGFVFELEETTSGNSPGLYISGISATTITSPNNNLQNGTWITLSGIANTVTDGVGNTLNGRNFQVVNQAGPAAQPNTFTLKQFARYAAPVATGASYSFIMQSPYIPIYPGSVRIYVGVFATQGEIIFTDLKINGDVNHGILTSNISGTVGTIDYITGAFTLMFSPALVGNYNVQVYVVSKNPLQVPVPVGFSGTYSGGGFITKRSNIKVISKLFNFLPQDKRSRLSKIDFYLNTTATGQFKCDVFADSTNIPVNRPLGNNSQSNVVLSSRNIYQVGNGSESIYRLYCDAIAQTLQIQLSLSDKQMAVDNIQSSNIEILALNFTLRPGGRLL